MSEFTFKQYHAAISPTVMPDYPDFGDNLLYPALGAAEEAGELAGKIKKLWRDHRITQFSQFQARIDSAGETIDIVKGQSLIAASKLLDGAVKEIGDVLWYLDAMATTL